MKNIIISILSLLIIVFAYSCKDKTEPTPDIVVIKPPAVDSAKLKPKVKFDYMLLDSGKVQVNYEVKDTIVWYVSSWMTSNSKSPLFRFETNGSYFISLRVMKNKKLFTDSTVKVTITNAINNPEYSTLKGTIFDKSFDFKKTALPSINTLFNVPFMPVVNHTPTASYNMGEQTIFIADYTAFKGVDYESMKKAFIKKKHGFAEYEGTPYAEFKLIKPGWFVSIWGEKGVYNFGNSPTDSLEIVNVEEVNQPKLFPEMGDKAFWVTWHIKADTGTKGKIDCTLRIKYIVYKQTYNF